MSTENPRLPMEALYELARWNTPTVYNGWEQVTRHDPATQAFNLEETHDFMPQMGPMVGWAVTVVIEPGNGAHPKRNPQAWCEYRRYVASVAGPKIVIVQDLDKPRVYGAFWGEVNSGIHRALGCVGSICDGAIRDLDEMAGVGFKTIARRCCVSHAHSWPVHWGGEVEVFGRKIQPGQLIHADKHGFIAIPAGEESHLVAAIRFMDAGECRTLIPAARISAGKTFPEICDEFDRAAATFDRTVAEKFGRKGEW